MGIKQFMIKRAEKAGDRIAKLSKLSPGQLEEMQRQREVYFERLSQLDPNDITSRTYTKSLLGTAGVEIFSAYLPQLKALYTPVDKNAELSQPFDPSHHTRYFNITRWVTDKTENSLEKLINVYEVLSNEDCNIALIFHRTETTTQVYLAVTDNSNDGSSVNANNFRDRLEGALRGNFPGAEWSRGTGTPPCLDNSIEYTVAAASNIPTEKSEKFVSQTIEKLLDGIIPSKLDQEYTIILLATPIADVEERKLRLSELYSGLSPYASWETNFTYTETGGVSSNAQLGVNVGASAGVQNGQNNSITNSNSQADSTTRGETNTEGSSEANSQGSSTSDSTGTTNTDSTTDGTNTAFSETENSSSTHAYGTNSSSTTSSSITDSSSITTSDSTTNGANASFNAGVEVGKWKLGGSAGVNHSHTTGTSLQTGHSYMTGSSNTTGSSITNSFTTGNATSITQGAQHSITQSLANTVTQTISKNVQKTISSNTSKAISNTLGRVLTNTAAATAGTFRSINLGTNFGVNFARSSNVTASVGKNEGLTQHYTNFTVKHALEVLEQQMKRFEKSTALGMWDFAAYVLSEDHNTANNVAHTYIALTQGEDSYMSRASVNIWRGNSFDEGERGAAKEICGYLRELRHPVFALDPKVLSYDKDFNAYPPVVTAATALSGKELSYSLNFPKKSVAGLPVIECAEFGRNVVTYDSEETENDAVYLGNIFHMNHTEKTPVLLSMRSLASHTFVTGSTGAGKTNTVCRILEQAWENGAGFLVIEPAKGEYKHLLGTYAEVKVYGTNPAITPLLRIDPFAFPANIHVTEHIDRLVEIFNVCWPMYAAMPAVLKDAVIKAYTDCGWDIVTSENSYGSGLYPDFSDVARNVKSIIESSEYDAENKGAYKGSLLTRLGSLTNGINGMIFGGHGLSDKALFDGKVIVDLSRVGSSETKSLIMGLLVLKLQEYRLSRECFTNELKHITVLEEAHNLLRRSSTAQSAESGDLLGKSVEMLSNAIAEMRSFGEGFIIADQAPGLLDMAAIRNTNTKIIMRLPDLDDRELVGKAANLNDDQIAELAKLPRGTAAVYQNEWVQPVLCRVSAADTSGKTYNFALLTTDADITDTDLTHRLQIADLLSSGTKIEKETVLSDIRAILKNMNMGAYRQVAVMKLLIDPPKEPRMTVLAPIMSSLFTDVESVVKTAYSDSRDAAEWTKAAEKALETNAGQISEQTRRDIIQAVITNYVFLQLGKRDDIERWTIEGGLK